MTSKNFEISRAKQRRGFHCALYNMYELYLDYIDSWLSYCFVYWCCVVDISGFYIISMHSNSGKLCIFLLQCKSCLCLFSLWHSFMMSFQSSCAELKFYIQSLRGTVQHYCINFSEEQSQMSTVVDQTLVLFQSLMKDLKDEAVSARLVTKLTSFTIIKKRMKWMNDAIIFLHLHPKK